MTMFEAKITHDKKMNLLVEESEIEALLKPETDLEAEIISVPEFRKGLLWGIPRYGHPEGQIVKHIVEVYNNIEKLEIDSQTREWLRIMTLVHDTFKYAEDKSSPRDWSKHHGILARKFLAQFDIEDFILEIVETHDEAYYIWRLFELYKKPELGKERLESLLEGMGERLQLYYLFFKCDTATGDKIPSPVFWFEKNIEGIEIVKF